MESIQFVQIPDRKVEQGETFSEESASTRNVSNVSGAFNRDLSSQKPLQHQQHVMIGRAPKIGIFRLLSAHYGKKKTPPRLAHLQSS